MATYAAPRIAASIVLAKTALQQVIDNLRAQRFKVIGPVKNDSAIVLEEIERIEQLPIGWTAQQRPGAYKLVNTGGGEYFGSALGPHSWKQFLHLPRIDVLVSKKVDGGWTFEPASDDPPPQAFLGVRACDLQAIQLLDRVFLNSYTDPHYAKRRQRLFIIAVNCNTPSENCFCQSMHSGPRAETGYDLAITELPDAFLMHIGSEAGSDVLNGVNWMPATAFDLGRATQMMQRAQSQFAKSVLTEDLPHVLFDNLEDARWDQIGARCLSCANCTMVCPTCFCNTMEDRITLDGQTATRTRVWDSCFVMDFSHMHAGNSRATTRARYRQWLTHKFASWKDQFGSLGCVGCGRCTTWCPVGIDITDEVRALRGLEAK